MAKLKGCSSVICCILSENCFTGCLEVIAVGIGTKSVPKKDYNKQGYIVIDMHAEVLARRALLRYLIKDGLGPNNLLVKCSEKEGHFNLKENIKLHMFTSRTPCGDSSMIV